MTEEAVARPVFPAFGFGSVRPLLRLCESDVAGPRIGGVVPHCGGDGAADIEAVVRLGPPAAGEAVLPVHHCRPVVAGAVVEPR